jgi:hypothetical protein
MGEVKNNLLTKGFSGKIGDEIVFRQVGERTLFAKRPRKRTELTVNQETQRENFRIASLYAKTMLLDPIANTYYAAKAKMAKLTSAYVAALTDYLRKPEINLISTDFYTGVIGSIIWITVVDAFKIQTMTVTVKRANDTILETGEAIFEGGLWKYTATQINAPLVGTKVIALAKDRPGKEAMLEKVL